MLLRKIESIIPASPEMGSDIPRSERAKCSRGVAIAYPVTARTLLFLASLTLGLACVDLNQPAILKQHLSSGTGGSPVTGVGGAGIGGEGGVIGTGGVGVGGAGAGGIVGTGGSAGTGKDASVGPDTSGGGAGGVAGSGGGAGSDGPADTGGIIGTGGDTTVDAPIGTGGSGGGAGGASTDAPGGTGGKVGTGGAGTGGVATGGAVTGGVVGTGGAGTGGVVGTGGAGTGGAVGTGGSSAVLNCAAAIVPANSSTNGLVTNFSDWNGTTAQWGSTTTGLNGTVFRYTDTGNASTTMTAATSSAGLHLTGNVGTWAGGGLTFLECATVASFTQVQFTIANATASSCALEMQIQTFALRPADQVPAGGCKADGGTCFGFPAKSAIVSLSATFAAKAVTTVLQGNFSNWSTANANQVVGVQWQFTGSACPVDVTISSVKFLP